jgi:transcriptional regulator of NAD metabolism
MGKETYISVRTSLQVREILEKLARQGYRTLSQQVEMAVIEWLKSQGYRFR